VAAARRGARLLRRPRALARSGTLPLSSLGPLSILALALVESDFQPLCLVDKRARAVLVARLARSRRHDIALLDRVLLDLVRVGGGRCLEAVQLEVEQTLDRASSSSSSTDELVAAVCAAGRALDVRPRRLGLRRRSAGAS
jgi:hypothetical protein